MDCLKKSCTLGLIGPRGCAWVLVGPWTRRQGGLHQEGGAAAVRGQEAPVVTVIDLCLDLHKYQKEEKGKESEVANIHIAKGPNVI